MARKSNKQIERELDFFYRYKWEKLRRNPNYIRDYEELMKHQITLYDKDISYQEWHRRSKKTNELEKKIYNKYDILYPLDPNDPISYRRYWPRDGMWIVRVINHRDHLPRLTDKAIKRWLVLLKRKPEESIKHILRDNRFLKLEIDTHREKRVIMNQISQIIDRIKSEKRKYGLEINYDKSPHLDKTIRYFKVFDLRNKKPPTPYDSIALTLIREGCYKGKTLKRVVNSVKKDYQIAFKEVFGIPYKEYDKSKLKKSDFNTCKGCHRYSMCKELCPEAEYVVAQVEVKPKERLFNKGVTDLI